MGNTVVSIQYIRWWRQYIENNMCYSLKYSVMYIRETTFFKADVNLSVES
jgi:hypothetical protein